MGEQRKTAAERFDEGDVVQIRGEGWPHVPLAQAILIAEQHAEAEVAALRAEVSALTEGRDTSDMLRRSAEDECAALRAEVAELKHEASRANEFIGALRGDLEDVDRRHEARVAPLLAEIDNLRIANAALRASEVHE